MTAMTEPIDYVTIGDQTRPVYPPLTVEQFDGTDCNGISMMEFETPAMVAHGHHEPADFVAAALVYYKTVCYLDPEDVEIDLSEVRQRWAVVTDPGDDAGEWQLSWHQITAETPGAFPITIWEA